MPVFYIPEYTADSFFERQVPSGKYRYEGHRSSIKYCIDSETRKSREQIYEYLDKRSIDFLIDNEGYILNI